MFAPAAALSLDTNQQSILETLARGDHATAV
jgi:hypothetical protein